MNYAEAAQILGVGSTPTADEVKQAYRKQAMMWHPDRPTGNTQKFQQINAAYEILSGKSKPTYSYSTSGWNAAADWRRNYWSNYSRSSEHKEAYAKHRSKVGDRYYRASKLDYSRIDRAKYFHGDHEWVDMPDGRKRCNICNVIKTPGHSGTYDEKYVKGQSCPARGLKHEWHDVGTYLKCSVCRATKHKPGHISTPRNRVENM